MKRLQIFPKGVGKYGSAYPVFQYTFTGNVVDVDYSSTLPSVVHIKDDAKTIAVTNMDFLVTEVSE